MNGKKFENFWDKISWTGCKWSSLNAPSTEIPVSHPLLSESLFPIFCPCCCFLSSSLWGNKKLDLSVWKVKNSILFGTKSAEQAASGPVLMPQVHKPSSTFGWILSPMFCPCCFLFSSLWGNKELDLPEWMVKSLKIFGTKSAEQAASGPVWMPQVQKFLCLIHFWVNPFSPLSAPAASFLPLDGLIRNWISQYER